LSGYGAKPDSTARPKPESDEDAHMDAGVPNVGPGEAQTTDATTFTA